MKDRVIELLKVTYELSFFTLISGLYSMIVATKVKVVLVNVLQSDPFVFGSCFHFYPDISLILRHKKLDKTT